MSIIPLPFTKMLPVFEIDGLTFPLPNNSGTDSPEPDCCSKAAVLSVSAVPDTEGVSEVTIHRLIGFEAVAPIVGSGSVTS